MVAGETYFKTNLWDLPGGTVDKNLLANSGDTGSVPGPEDSTYCRQLTCVPQLRPCTRDHVLQQQEPPQ